MKKKVHATSFHHDVTVHPEQKKKYKAKQNNNKKKPHTHIQDSIISLPPVI